MTIKEIQEEIIRLKKEKISAYWHMLIRDMRFLKLQIIWEIHMDLAWRRARIPTKI